MSVIRQPMDVILGTIAGVRVMRVLLAHGGPLPVARLVRDARVSPNGVRDALRLLEQAGVVDALGAGRSSLYSARHDNPIVPFLESLFASERHRFEQVLQSISNAAAFPEVVSTWLFGSVARAEDTVSSDVDIAVVIDAPAAAIPSVADAVRDRLADRARALAFSASVIAFSVDDLLRLRNEKAPLWTSLLQDAQVLAGLAPQDLVSKQQERRQHGADGHVEESRLGLRAWPVEESPRIPGGGAARPGRPV
jgi:predicted nucleotidyltransferase/DNA-binding transcriptional ArsR family regulator